jgi:hypothetical protein
VTVIPFKPATQRESPELCDKIRLFHEKWEREVDAMLARMFQDADKMMFLTKGEITVNGVRAWELWTRLDSQALVMKIFLEAQIDMLCWERSTTQAEAKTILTTVLDGIDK